MTSQTLAPPKVLEFVQVFFKEGRMMGEETNGQQEATISIRVSHKERLPLPTNPTMPCKQGFTPPIVGLVLVQFRPRIYGQVRASKFG